MFAVWSMQPLPPMTFQASAHGCASEPFSEPFWEAAFLCHRARVWSGLRALCLLHLKLLHGGTPVGSLCQRPAHRFGVV